LASRLLNASISIEFIWIYEWPDRLATFVASKKLFSYGIATNLF